MATLDGRVLHSIEDLQAGDDFTRRKNLDLELAIGARGHPLRNHLGAPKDSIETLGETRRKTPLDLRLGALTDGRRGDGASSKSGPGFFQK